MSNTSNGFQDGYYEPKETTMFYWKCSNGRCFWQSEASEDESDLKSVECCPDCKCSTVVLESDIFEVFP